MKNFKYTINYTEYTIEWIEHETGASIEYNIYYDFNNRDRTHLLHGYVKWDGCSDWDFVECRTCMLHACTRSGLIFISELPQICWDHCSKTLEQFDMDLAAD